MKNIGFAAALMAAGVLASSCMIRLDKKKWMQEISEINVVTPSNVTAVKDTSVSRFNAVSYGGRIKVFLIQDNAEKNVTVSASDNILPFIKVYVEDGTLHIDSKVKRRPGVYLETDDDVVVTLHSPSVDLVNIAGGGELICDSLDMSGRELSIKISGSAEVDFGKIMAGSLMIAVSGSGEFDVDSVSADGVTVSVSGSGSVGMDELETGNVNAAVSGSGSIEFKGKAGTAVFSVAGSGDIDAEKLKCGTVSTHVGGSGTIKYMDKDGKVHDTDE